VIQTSARG